MRVLALDAALGPFSVALDVDGIVSAGRSVANDALETGLGRIAAMLADAGLRLRDVERIAVGVGPGSFTGIRIALSFAKSLAYGAALPLVGISTYDVLTPPGDIGPCLTLVAGRPGILCARLVANGGVRVACGPAADVARTLLEGWPANAELRVAASSQDALAALGGRLPRGEHLVSPAASQPAVALAALARIREPALSPHGVAPDYGEMPAVTIPKAGTKTKP